jgi:hypothetical protein
MIGQQPLRRARAQMGQNLVDLGHLLGKMHVDRAGRADVRIAHSALRDRPRAGNGGHADGIVGGRGQWRAASACSRRNRSGRCRTVVLPAVQRPQVAAAVLVMHRQQGQADPGLLSRGATILSDISASAP